MYRVDVRSILWDSVGFFSVFCRASLGVSLEFPGGSLHVGYDSV